MPRGLFVAVVGTRKATGQGLSAAKTFAKSLAHAGAVVVSGLALGIDAAAHAGSLAGGGKTVAVLGSGLEHISPRTNLHLAEEILKSGGALISEYPSEEEARDYRFLERNRIIAGLCKAVLIIEAPERSGSLATARFALEANRDIFVLPGPAGHPNFKGSHRLIREGATLVDDPSQLIEDLGLNIRTENDPAAEMTLEESAIFSLLQNAGRALSIDEIAEKTKLTPPAIHRNLTVLLLKDAVREEPCGYAV